VDVVITYVPSVNFEVFPFGYLFEYSFEFCFNEIIDETIVSIFTSPNYVVTALVSAML